jgi:hypothetical protein
LALGRFIGGTLCGGTFCSWDVFGLGRFVLGRFVGAPIPCFWVIIGTRFVLWLSTQNLLKAVLYKHI